MFTGLFGVILNQNNFKKLISLSIFQASAILLFIPMGYIHGSVAPILRDGAYIYAHPLPHVLMLTAIVVGFAIMSIGISLIMRIKK